MVLYQVSKKYKTIMAIHTSITELTKYCLLSFVNTYLGIIKLSCYAIQFSCIISLISI